MTASPSLPRGMRLNNPGNLRANANPDHRTRIVEGFCQFETLELGCEALARVVWNNYTHLGLRTLTAFVGRYAPASENDTLLYTRMLARDLGQSPLATSTYDLRLDKAWPALHLMRGIVSIEQGRPQVSWPSWPEWVAPGMWVLSMSNTHYWKDVGV